jgi:hypothetical protein
LEIIMISKFLPSGFKSEWHLGSVQSNEAREFPPSERGQVFPLARCQFLDDR